jgi:hypothetical protein
MNTPRANITAVKFHIALPHLIYWHILDALLKELLSNEASAPFIVEISLRSKISPTMICNICWGHGIFSVRTPSTSHAVHALATPQAVKTCLVMGLGMLAYLAESFCVCVLGTVQGPTMMLDCVIVRSIALRMIAVVRGSG